MQTLYLVKVYRKSIWHLLFHTDGKTYMQTQRYLVTMGHSDPQETQLLWHSCSFLDYLISDSLLTWLKPLWLTLKLSVKIFWGCSILLLETWGFIIEAGTKVFNCLLDYRGKKLCGFCTSSQLYCSYIASTSQQDVCSSVCLSVYHLFVYVFALFYNYSWWCWKDGWEVKNTYHRVFY